MRPNKALGNMINEGLKRAHDGFEDTLQGIRHARTYTSDYALSSLLDKLEEQLINLEFRLPETWRGE